MLTRLKVNGFKSLVDVDVRFGPFTCIAGANGVGKSNLFDAIRFLSALAGGKTLLEAAKEVRDEEGKSADIRWLFSRRGEHIIDRMSFEVEMIVPAEGHDRLGQSAKAKIRFLHYSLELAYHQEEASLSQGAIRVLREELRHIKKSDAAKHLLFPHKAKTWRDSVIQGRRTSPFISTEYSLDGSSVIKAHQEGNQGAARRLAADSLPRTVLSEANASESETATVARHEMMSWRLLQLEPTALRRSDDFTAPNILGLDGSHLPNSLYHLSRLARMSATEGEKDAAEQAVFAQVSSRLGELLEDVRDVRIDRDDKREQLTLEVSGKDGAFHAARALSDGTLRFLALAVLEAGNMEGVLCLEEPENGIHPARIEPMLRLLQDIAVDTEEAVDPENPLRQVIVNTHSPSVVSLVDDDALLVADKVERIDQQGRRFLATEFRPLPDTWRVTKAEKKVRCVAKGELLSYLAPAFLVLGPVKSANNRRRVGQREDVRQWLLPLDADSS